MTAVRLDQQRVQGNRLAMRRTLPVPQRIQAVEGLRRLLRERQMSLATDAARVVRTPLRHHKEDVEHTRRALFEMQEIVAAPRGCWFRPRGVVTIGLSSNEPLIVGIVPICASYLAGNHTLIRPASSNRSLMKQILDLVVEAGVEQDAIELVGAERNDLDNAIDRSDHVVWFGSSRTCRSVGTRTIGRSRTFIGDAEGFDLAVFDDTVPDEDIPTHARRVIASVARHDGQTCQAIRAILVHESRVGCVVEALRSEVERLVIGSSESTRTDCTILPTIIRRSRLRFPRRAPFGPTCLLSPYVDLNGILDPLRNNPYGLSLTIFTRRSSSELRSTVLAAARVGRVLINGDPGDVDPRLPWGGYGRSGLAGPQRWIEKFADICTVSGLEDG